MEFQMKLKRFLKQETVLSVAAVLAVLSMFFVPPDADYLGYIDLRTLAILFSLMTIMAGLRRQGVFDRMGRALLARTGSTLQLMLVLVGLCFFGSMVITNVRAYTIPCHRQGLLLRLLPGWRGAALRRTPAGR